MHFNRLSVVGIAAILSLASAAPALPPRSAVPAPVPHADAACVPGSSINCVDSGDYLKRAVNRDKNGIVIGSRKRSPRGKLPTLEDDDTYPVDEDWPADEDWPVDSEWGGPEDESYPVDEEYAKRSASSKKRSPHGKLPTLEDDDTYPVDEDWPADEDWPVDSEWGGGEDESYPVDEDYAKRALTHDPLPTGDDDGYLRRTKIKRSPEEPAEDVGAYDEEDGVPFKRSPMRADKTCGPEEDLACYPDGSNGKRAPLNPQPLPPGIVQDKSIKRSPLNPQPLPPGIVQDDSIKRSPLNPQPLPPGKVQDKTIKRSPMRADKTCGPEEDLACYPDGSNGKRSPLNPQPLPPGIVEDNSIKRSPRQPIDGDYPVPNDDSYPVRRAPRPPPVDVGDYAPPDENTI